MDTILYFQSPSKTSTPDKIAGVQRHAAAVGWHVQIVDGFPTPSALARLVEFWHPLGAIVDCGGGYAEVHVDMFKGIPTVYLDRNPKTMPKNASCVSHDSFSTGQLAAKELLVAGHPNFAFVPYPQPRFWSDDRERGFKDALALNGKSCETFPGGAGRSLQSVAWQRRLRRWLEKLPKPCGIFAANDSVAVEVITAAEQGGLAIAREIAVCGVDTSVPICERTTPTLTSVQPDFLLAGELAARTLGEMAAGKFRQAVRLTFGPADVVRRASSRTGIRYDAEVAAAAELIRRKACERLTAKDVIATFKCSRRMAEMRFRQILGHSILAEIQAVRLTRAKELLANSTQDIASIPSFCGLKTANALCKFFRKETGKSPSEWRSSRHSHFSEEINKA